jgi:tetratricopeptide (TPR) repeat protein
MELESVGRTASAQASYEEILDLWRQLGDPRGTAPALINLGYLARVEGDRDRAGDLFENGLAAAQLSGERSWRVLAKINLGQLAAGQDDDVQARTLYHEALLICLELRSNWWAAESIALLANLEARQDHPDRLARAARMWGAAQILYKHSGSSPRQLEYGSGRRPIAAARRLGDDAFTEAWSQGQSMTFDQALAYGLEEPDG